MNLTNSEVQPHTSSVDTQGDSAKLLSLLALATGAVAIPQTSNADIVFVDLSANPVHIGQLWDSSYIINTLPGTAQIGFFQHSHVTAISSSRSVTGRQQAGYVRLLTNAAFLVAANASNTWNQVKAQAGVHASIFGTAAFASYNAAFPGSFSGKYYLFEFKDSTQGNAMRFGWINVSLANAPASNLPELTISGYAYDTTGAMLGSGQVPEPSVPALLALGAMAFGAKGLRSWRKNRPAQTKS